jgi:hypothetical protein
MGRSDQVRDFQNYDFQACDKWQAYLRSVEVVSNDPGTTLRLKGRWYKKNIVRSDMTWVCCVVPSSWSSVPA